MGSSKKLLPGSQDIGLSGLKVGDNIITEKKDLMNIFNKHLTSIGNTLAAQLPNSDLNHKSIPTKNQQALQISSNGLNLCR